MKMATGPLLPTHSLCLPCSISASCKNSAVQNWLSSSVRPCIADLSATVAKHAGKFGSQFKMGFPHKQNPENIISLEVLRISGILTTLKDKKCPTTHNAALFLIRSDFRLSRQLVLSTNDGPFSPRALNGALNSRNDK